VLNGSNDQYGFAVQLSESWQDFTIPITNFNLADQLQQAKTPWDSVASKIQRIECVFHGNLNQNQLSNLELEIDDISFEGVLLDSL